MPKFDLSITIVGIIAVVALLSPPITSLIENIFKLKSQRLAYRNKVYDDLYEHKREIFENFLKNTGLVSYERKTYLEELTRSYYALIPYIPTNELHYFRDYCNLIQQNDQESIIEELQSLLHNGIIPCIKRELDKDRLLKR